MHVCPQGNLATICEINMETSQTDVEPHFNVSIYILGTACAVLHATRWTSNMFQVNLKWLFLYFNRYIEISLEESVSWVHVCHWDGWFRKWNHAEPLRTQSSSLIVQISVKYHI